MQLKKALLEEWMRDYYFSTDYDIGSSGVHNFSLGELSSIIDTPLDRLSSVRFDDSETLGNIKLRKAVAEKFGDGDARSVLIGNGSNEVIFCILHSLLNLGDEVITMSPSYHALGSLANILCTNVKEWFLDSSSDFMVDTKKLKSLVSKNTKMIIVNFPHNPTGVSITKSQYLELVNVAIENNAYLCWDAAFQDLPFELPALPNPYLLHKKAIYFGTTSKSYGLAGLRLGWCIADPQIINNCKVIKDYTSLYVSPLIEAIGLSVIKNIDKINTSIRSIIDKNFLLLKIWLTENQDIVKGNLPQGGVSAFIKVLGYSNTEALCKYLADIKKTLVVPGICFGHPSYIRLGIGGKTEDMEIGLTALAEVIRAGLLKNN